MRSSLLLRLSLSAVRSLFSLFLGLEDVVRFSLSEGSSSYYIGGVLRNLTADVRRLLAVVGLSSPVSNAALSLLLKDDRLPHVLPDVPGSVHHRRPCWVGANYSWWTDYVGVQKIGK